MWRQRVPLNTARRGRERPTSRSAHAWGTPETAKLVYSPQEHAWSTSLLECGAARSVDNAKGRALLGHRGTWIEMQICTQAVGTTHRGTPCFIRGHVVADNLGLQFVESPPMLWCGLEPTPAKIPSVPEIPSCGTAQHFMSAMSLKRHPDIGENPTPTSTQVLAYTNEAFSSA